MNRAERAARDPPPSRSGRPRKTDLREVVNAIIYYTLRAGRARRMLPLDPPPRQTVYACFRTRKSNGTGDTRGSRWTG